MPPSTSLTSRGQLIAAVLHYFLPKDLVTIIATQALEDDLYNYPALLVEYVEGLTEEEVWFILGKNWRFAAVLATRKNKWQHIALKHARFEARRQIPSFYGEIHREHMLEKAMWIAMLPPMEWLAGEAYDFKDDEWQEGQWMQMVVCWAIEHGNYPAISDDNLKGELMFWKDIARIAAHATCPNVIRKLLCKVVTGDEVIRFICDVNNAEILEQVRDDLVNLPDAYLGEVNRQILQSHA